MPEPRLGPVNAPIVVLQLNPSYDKATIQHALSKEEVQDSLASLHNELSPHVCLANGNSWWQARFRDIIAEVGAPMLAQRVCSIEYFAYPSATFSHAWMRLPSQTYTFALVRAALERNALILITRGTNLWLGAVPELLQALGSTAFETNNPRSASISQRNLPDGVFAKVIEAAR